jgi:hypothetical protein
MYEIDTRDENGEEWVVCILTHVGDKKLGPFVA